MSILWNIYQVWIVHNYSPAKWKWIVPAIHLEASQSECTESITHLSGICYCTLQMNYNIIQPRPQGASLFESEKVGKSPWIILFKKTRDELIKKNEGQHFIFDVN